MRPIRCLVGRGALNRLTACRGSPLTSIQRSYATPAATPTPPINFKLHGFLAFSIFSASIGLFVWERRTATPVEGNAGESFSYYVKTASGRKDFIFARRSETETEAMLHENETSERIRRNGNPVIKWDQNWLGSNEPCEDRSAIDTIQRGPAAKAPSLLSVRMVPETAGEGSRDLIMFSVLDGHGGDATSKLLAKALHPTIGLELASLQAGHLPRVREGGVKALAAYLNPLAWIGGKTWTSDNIVLSLQDAFLQLDDNICQSPFRLLPSMSSPKKVDPGSDLPLASQTFKMMTDPAGHGAVAISTVIDAENDDLYVACTGDCRAVAGWQDKEGKWRCDILSEDQMGENPVEIGRMLSEHPASERDSVIRTGRVQGGLQPTRAFGDAVYKWTPHQAAAVSAVYKSWGERFRPQRPNTFTPPYVTAKPEVTHRKISSINGETLRFIVMATDGLWDRITSEESTLLVASHLSHRAHSDIPKTELPKQYPLLPPVKDRPYPAEDLPGTAKRSNGAWVFEGDENAATHLIKNSLAGADRPYRNQLLSMHGEVTRNVRDDITVIVVFVDEKR